MKQLFTFLLQTNRSPLIAAIELSPEELPTVTVVQLHAHCTASGDPENSARFLIDFSVARGHGVKLRFPDNVSRRHRRRVVSLGARVGVDVLS